MSAQRKQGAGRTGARKLHSIAGLLHGREFTGSFEARGENYRFTFAPTSAAISEGRLVLTGPFTVESPRGEPRTVAGVSGKVASTQGGLGSPPARRQLVAGTAQTGQVATPEQKQEQASDISRTGGAPPLPITESTGDIGFVGVLYIHFAPLDARALGVPADLDKVQLNARLAPVDDTAQGLQWLFTAIAAAVYAEPPNTRAAAGHVEELNRVLKG